MKRTLYYDYVRLLRKERDELRAELSKTADTLLISEQNVTHLARVCGAANSEIRAYVALLSEKESELHDLRNAAQAQAEADSWRGQE